MMRFISVILAAALSLAAFPFGALAAESQVHKIEGKYDGASVTFAEYLGVKEETFTLDDKKVTAKVYSVAADSRIRVVPGSENRTTIIFPAKLSSKKYKTEAFSMISLNGSKNFKTEKQFELYRIMLAGDTIYVKVEAGKKTEAKGKPVTIEEPGYGKIILSDVISQREENISLDLFGGRQKCIVYYVSSDSTVRFLNKNESVFIPYKKDGNRYTQDSRWKQLTIFKGNKTFTLEAKYDLYLAATLKPGSDRMMPAVIKVVKE